MKTVLRSDVVDTTYWGRESEVCEYAASCAMGVGSALSPRCVTSAVTDHNNKCVTWQIWSSNVFMIHLVVAIDVD